MKVPPKSLNLSTTPLLNISNLGKDKKLAEIDLNAALEISFIDGASIFSSDMHPSKAHLSMNMQIGKSIFCNPSPSVTILFQSKMKFEIIKLII